MDSSPDWIPADLDLSKASSARVYDYYLGGVHNFPVDRELARKVLRLHPAAASNAKANRAFLNRTVRFLLAQGVRQFVDLGAGIPTAGNVHETVAREDPASRVLYVDRDPIAVTHSQLILGRNPNAKVLRADLRRPKGILESAPFHDLIDLSQPVAVLMVAVLHFVSEADHPEQVIGEFHDVVAPGSHLVISHSLSDALPAGAEQAKALFKTSATDQVTTRSRTRILELLSGWDLVEPGLVPVPDWRPDPRPVWAADEAESEATKSFVVGAVARRA